MNRRRFLEVSLGTVVYAQLLGCEHESAVTVMEHTDVKIPLFSKDNLHEKLDALLKAYQAKGLNASDSLLPGISASELKSQCSWFPGELTEEIVALYEWRGGQAMDAWEVEFPFWFRDNSFCSIERARAEYESMMQSYGAHAPDAHMLKHAFPIASFNGGWYVIPTKGHNLDSALNRPVISVFEGIDVFYYSLEKMVETCLEWVSHENYAEDGLYPQELELKIWRKHNPGIFQH